MYFDKPKLELLLAFGAIIFATLVISLTARANKLQLQADHVPNEQVARAKHIGRLNAATPMTMTVALTLRNQAVLGELIARMYDSKDPLFQKYLTPQTFAEQFGPAAEDVAAVKAYLAAHNLTVTKTTTNTIQFKGVSSDIEKAFALELHQYQAPDGGTAYAPTSNPLVDASISSKMIGVLGLNSFSKLVAHRIRRSESAFSPLATPNGSGPNGGLSPSDIQRAYALSGGALNGSGQSLALMELDGYTASDILNYAKYFSLSKIPTLQNVLIDGFNGSAGSGADEVTLDIELMMAVAPGASKVLVYEGPNNESGPIDVYTKIADDNIAKQVSTSWGSPESQNTSAFLNAENSIFMQMAAQGQSIYAASGDSGAYDDGSSLGVDDPASQPYVTATGGTTLSIGSGGAYQSESSWGIKGSSQASQQGGGGGVSGVWPMPPFQTGLATASNGGSNKMRMVPDISIDANPQTGYAIYVGGQWQVFGGTSCAAPVWAGLTALVNQTRAAAGLSSLGYAAPAIYKVAQTAYAANFHDVRDNSTNLFYAAVTGYDLSTGLGTPIASALIPTLAGVAVTPTPTPTSTPTEPPPAPSNLTVTSVIVN